MRVGLGSRSIIIGTGTRYGILQQFSKRFITNTQKVSWLIDYGEVTGRKLVRDLFPLHTNIFRNYNCLADLTFKQLTLGIIQEFNETTVFKKLNFMVFGFLYFNIPIFGIRLQSPGSLF